jgi:hypothetical protein
MNAGGVDKACKSNGSNLWKLLMKVAILTDKSEIDRLVADEVVTRRYAPQSRE